MRLIAFTSRNRKEILRDPINLGLGIGFPIIVLLLLSTIQANIPVELFVIDKLIPGIAVFGLSFMSIFSGLLLAKDRGTSFLMRLFTTPLTPSDYILGYTLPLIPMAILQVIISFIAALFLGLPVNVNILLAIVVLIPTAILFIAIGLLVGSIFNEKQVSTICGAILINLSAWLSGTWIDLSLIGGWFEKIAHALPFAHAVEAGRAAVSSDYQDIMPHLIWVIGYAVVLLISAIIVFRKKMHCDQ